MTFEMICADCHATYEVGKAEIARGIAYWSRCPNCRPTDQTDQERSDAA